MDLKSLKPNSRASKEGNEEKSQGKNLQKAVLGTVIVKEKTAPHKFFRTFLAEDAKTIEKHVVEEVVKPRLLDIIFAAAMDGLEMALYGQISTRRSRGGGGYTSYGNYYRGSDDRKREKKSESRSKPLDRRTIYDLEEMEFEFREDAQNVLDAMCDVLEEYPAVSGADLCQLLGKPINYTDRKYGWTDLGKARIERLRGGNYVLILPRAEVLE